MHGFLLPLISQARGLWPQPPRTRSHHPTIAARPIWQVPMGPPAAHQRGDYLIWKCFVWAFPEEERMISDNFKHIFSLATTYLRWWSHGATGWRAGISHLGVPGEIGSTKSSTAPLTASGGVTTDNAHRYGEWKHAVWPFLPSLDSH